jgi:hypothetical protein
MNLLYLIPISVIALFILLFILRNNKSSDPNGIRKFSALTVSSGIKSSYYGASHENIMSARFKKFSGNERRSLKLFSGETAVFSYEFNLDIGSMHAELIKPDGEAIAKFDDKKGDDIQIKIDTTGVYRMKVFAEKASGEYKISFIIKNN